MKVLILIVSIVLPIVMIILQIKWTKIRILYHSLALLAALTFGNIASFAIYTVLRDNTVFMTNIHALFLNPLFLLTGAYLGIYFVYVIMRAILEEKAQF
ncbi:transposase [Alkalihalobacterium chitinilyticum]|uniref:Transposase n=1 Tax=Alkalihalobacterium chitinilyticum TaxID=2980103 RepID=A0ABT5VHZ1_9BACI|nr:transposase [Alkalihalobacterium chitinilyticum]MDE5415070.1 transposase [Alkalihalobacterium chitinilyticum]